MANKASARFSRPQRTYFDCCLTHVNGIVVVVVAVVAVVVAAVVVGATKMSKIVLHDSVDSVEQCCPKCSNEVVSLVRHVRLLFKFRVRVRVCCSFFIFFSR